MINLYRVEYQHQPDVNVIATSKYNTTMPWNPGASYPGAPRHILANNMKDAVAEADKIQPNSEWKVSGVQLVETGLQLLVSRNCSMADLYNPGPKE